jgi:hypothetical protein
VARTHQATTSHRTIHHVARAAEGADTQPKENGVMAALRDGSEC